MNKALLFLATLFILITSCDRSRNHGCYLEEKTINNQRVIEIYNANVKARFTLVGRKILQEFLAFDKKQWIPIAQSFLPPSDSPKGTIRLYNSSLDPANRLITSEILDSIAIVEYNKNQAVLLLTGNAQGH